LLKKETLVLSKDLHGLAVLFIMPAVFILIMSMAMQNAFDEHQSVSIDYAVVNLSGDTLAGDFIRLLQDDSVFKAQVLKPDTGPLSELVARDQYKFAIIVPQDFAQRLRGRTAEPQVLRVLVAPTVKPYMKQLFLVVLRGAVIKMKTALSFGGSVLGSMTNIDSLNKVDLDVRYVFNDNDTVSANLPTDDRDGKPKSTGTGVVPSSVQQNVPAWLMFAMFFVIIPISTAFLIEKQQGTFVRLRLMNISTLNLLLAKLAPYYVVNQIQMVLMIGVGMYLVPLLGGDRLNWPSSVFGLLIISSAASFAAISFALLIATYAKTTVQATTMGGVFNIIFGALGGIMVPKFVMPPTMQEITVASPMSWGLEGFLDMFLRNAHWTAVLPEALALFAFGLVAISGATVLFKKLV
jgi:ABC-2 type transport system permease protein